MDNKPGIIREWRDVFRKICEERSPVEELAWIAEGFHSKLSKTNGKRRRNASQKIRKESALKSRDSCGNLCLPVQSSMMEIEPFNNVAGASTNSTMPEHALSPDTNWDTVLNRPNHDSALRRSYFSIREGVSVQDPVFVEQSQRKRSELMVWRRGQKKVMEQHTATIDEADDNSACQFWVRNGDTSAENSACNFMSGIAERVNLENSEACWRPSDGVKDQNGAAEIGFEGLHLLADAAVWMLENDEPHVSPQQTQGMASSQQWIRKAIFFLTGEPYPQKRVIRRARSAYRKKYDPRSPTQQHNMQNLKPAVSEAISQSRHNQDLRPKRMRLHIMPSKYSDSVLHTWKKGTRR